MKKASIDQIEKTKSIYSEEAVKEILSAWITRMIEDFDFLNNIHHASIYNLVQGFYDSYKELYQMQVDLDASKRAYRRLAEGKRDD